MDILLWLVPAAVVTVLSMLWVAFVSREGRTLDPDEAVRRLGAALERETRRRRKKPLPGYAAPRPREEPTSTIAIRLPSGEGDS
ncbi:MAG: hypothetical protein J2O46_04505 [Nocardioides sp.]|nr:hypothetical protein [Nocardioides sp.]